MESIGTSSSGGNGAVGAAGIVEGEGVLDIKKQVDCFWEAAAIVV